MNDVLHALAISAGILFPVVILIIVISMFVVKRGEVAHDDSGHDAPSEAHVGAAHIKEGAAAAPAKAVKPAASPADEEISVPYILLLGGGLFVITIVALLLLSLITHMN